MAADTLICRCRFCSRTFSYESAEAGCQANCPHCHQPVLLPGHLQLITVKKVERINSFPTLAMEIGGFILMIFYPFGTILGIVLVITGWRQSYKLRCGNCDAVINNADQEKCPKCKARFASE
ncbi:MAG: hypothetical protein ACO1QB_08960 [Verrucomicrobiales bacterium]